MVNANGLYGPQWTSTNPPEVSQLTIVRRSVSWVATAEALGIGSLTTIARWLKDPEFAIYRNELRDAAMSRVNAQYLANIEAAFEVVGEVLKGTIKRDDDRAVEARAIIDPFLRACLYVPPPGGSENGWTPALPPGPD